ncbi:MAG: hypothetical protein JJE35_14450 [Thermoleophilia bacterium]|nr:hypothetical protein [Thermoleophilia bacterium]
MERVIPEGTMDWSRFDSHRRVRVVGDAFHQPALLAASKRKAQYGARYECQARLVLEPDKLRASDPAQPT